jgi:hypothetical protein
MLILPSSPDDYDGATTRSLTLAVLTRFKTRIEVAAPAVLY